jgi:xanthosine utilization system XapX-like protein
MKRLLLVFAFVAFGAFLAILAFEVPSPDLIAVIVLTLVLVAYDFAMAMRKNGD